MHKDIKKLTTIIRQYLKNTKYKDLMDRHDWEDFVDKCWDEIIWCIEQGKQPTIIKVDSTKGYTWRNCIIGVYNPYRSDIPILGPKTKIPPHFQKYFKNNK